MQSASRIGGAAKLLRLRASAAAALAIWFAVTAAGLGENASIWLTALNFAPTLGFVAAWVPLETARPVRTILAVLLAVLVLAAVPLAVQRQWQVVASLPAVIALAVLVLTGRRREAVQSSGWLGLIAAHPSRLLVTTFAWLILAGTLVLALPASSAGERGVNLFDAAFTAVSAVCVTGLIVLDTPHDFSGFGQAAILILIQLGGLGIMTFSAAALGLLGRRLSVRHEGSLAGLLSGDDRSNLTQALKALFLVTFTAEAAGAALLSTLFAAEGDGWATAIWRGVFTAVSAFCNAGFALQSDSLMGYRESGLVLHIVALLIVLGGLSPLTVLALPDWVRGRSVSLQVKVSLTATAILLAVGTLMFAAVEWSAVLDGMSWAQRLHNAWFQSATLRTAGFNSVDIAQLQPATLSLMMVWMFIGGSPGGTAGGIKTTTLALLLMAIAGALRGRSRVIVFGRFVSQATLYRASTIATVGALVVGVALMAMQLTQHMTDQMAIFEVISALGTVGLSIGGTARLDRVGEVIIMACMFVGRVGPLTMLVFLAGRKSSKNWDYPEGQVEVG